jgi:hypothetical protein
VTVSGEGFGVETGTSVGANGVSVGTVGGLAVPVGVGWNPFKGDLRNRAFKPFLAIGGGPVIGYSDGTFLDDGTITTGSVSRSTVGARFGAGFDMHVARSFSIGLEVGYNEMLNFSEPVGLHKNFNGVRVALGVGWLFGKGVQ